MTPKRAAKVRRALELKSQGLKQLLIAQRMGVSEGEVSKLLRDVGKLDPPKQ